MKETPFFWKTDLDTIAAWAGKASRAEVKSLCKTAGGRDLLAFFYGEKQVFDSRANYSSACGAHDKSCDAPVTGTQPVVILLGAVHGGETEGTAALVNLISLLETGVDLKGERHDELTTLCEKARLVIIPVCNPDGRVRVKLQTMLGCTFEELRYWMQGTWKDGSLCGWPDCKKRHPIKDYVDFLGGYYNDDGINLMHDNFFHPMASETQALMDLCDNEHADWILHLHGGGNSVNALLQTSYVTQECQRAICELQKVCDEEAQKYGLRFATVSETERESGRTPPSFNLTSALHHVCGGVSAVFECNERIVDMKGELFTHEQVYLSHLILFTQCLKLAVGARD